jgi:hypothetical protein
MYRCDLEQERQIQIRVVCTDIAHFVLITLDAGGFLITLFSLRRRRHALPWKATPVHLHFYYTLATQPNPQSSVCVQRARSLLLVPGCSLLKASRMIFDSAEEYKRDPHSQSARVTRAFSPAVSAPSGQERQKASAVAPYSVRNEFGGHGEHASIPTVVWFVLASARVPCEVCYCRICITVKL